MVRRFGMEFRTRNGYGMEPVEKCSGEFVLHSDYADLLDELVKALECARPAFGDTAEDAQAEIIDAALAKVRGEGN